MDFEYVKLDNLEESISTLIPLIYIFLKKSKEYRLLNNIDNLIKWFIDNKEILNVIIAKYNEFNVGYTVYREIYDYYIPAIWIDQMYAPKKEIKLTFLKKILKLALDKEIQYIQWGTKRISTFKKYNKYLDATYVNICLPIDNLMEYLNEQC